MIRVIQLFMGKSFAYPANAEPLMGGIGTTQRI